jgi:hypothetical protein
MGNGACIELLRGAQLSERLQKKPRGLLGVINKACSSYKSGKGGDQRDDDLLKELMSKFTVVRLSLPNVISLESTTTRGLHHVMSPISLRKIQTYSIQHSFLYCVILRMDLFLDFSADLV